MERSILKVIADNVPALIGCWDRDLLCQFANRTYEDWFGLSPDVVVGKHISLVLGENLFERNIPYIEKALRGERQQFEREIPKINGDVVSAIIHYIPHHVDNMPAGFFVIAFDVTELKNAKEALEAVYRFQDTVLNSTQASIIATDVDGVITLFNAGAEAMLGFSKEEMIGRQTPALFHDPGEVAQRAAQIGEETGTEIEPGFEVFVFAARQGEICEHEWTYIRKNGHRLPVLLSVSALRDGRGGLTGFLGVARDISADKKAEAEMLLAASVFHNTAEGILISDPDVRTIAVNPAFTEITGYTAEEAVGKTPRILKSDRQDKTFYRNMWESLLLKGRWQGEIWNRRKDGEAFLAWETISVVRDDKGQILRFVSVFNDITELHRKDEHIRHQAYHDALTGLPNRQLLLDRLGLAIERARREGGQLAVLFIDLDRFKIVNDSLGHDVGDMLLIQISAWLQQCVSRSDTIARLGGDEFIVVLSDFASSGEVAEVAERIVAQLSQPMHLKGHEVRVGASIGIAMFPQDGNDVVALMQNADVAMYRSKSAGRDTFHFFDNSMNSRAIDRLQMEADLRHAVENGELELYYQPKINIDQGHLDGAEALLRWNHPKRGFVSPDRFIPLAEETGLILSIGNWVISEACRQIRSWRNAGLTPPRIAVNLSARQFQDPSLPDRLRDSLSRAGLEASALEVELTESAVMRDPQKAVAMMECLNQMGVRISVDDFGTGYSSLAYLRRFPIGVMKIDRSFVTDFANNPEDAAIVRMIIALGRTLDLEIVAEGVETEAQLAFLKECGCTTAQGYFHSRPLSAQAFIAWAKARAVSEPTQQQWII
ncbi:MAG: EAL domain-containing protein [Alphaproteobacteria bacterium]